MNATVPSASQCVAALTKEQEEQDTSLSVTLDGIDGCLRSWKGARHEGQAVLTGLSNAVLLRTYVDSGGSHRTPGVGGTGVGGEGGAVWGALANAGGTVSRVSAAAEARTRRLHGDLSALQDAMLAAAGGLRGHAQDLRRRCSPGMVAASEGAAAAARAGGDSDGLAGAAEALEPVSSFYTSSSSPDDVRANAAVGGGYGLIDVADAVSEVAEMMLKEAFVTATVVQGVGAGGGGVGQDDDGRREALTVYSAAWMMQPYVDARLVNELERMVGRGGSGGKRA